MPISLRGLHPQVREAADWALGWAAYYSVPVTVTSTYRSWAEQRALRARWEECLRTGRAGQPGPCQYPANQPGDSAHNWGLAWDSTVPPEYQSWWNAVRRAAGFEVLDNDQIHAQVPQWRQYVQQA
jgi:hypothetical protein